LPQYLLKEVGICCNFQKNNVKIVSHLTKTETPLVIWLNIVTMVARSVRLLLAHIRKDIHATRQFHCQWWSGQCHPCQTCRKWCVSSQHLLRQNRWLFTKNI